MRTDRLFLAIGLAVILMVAGCATVNTLDETRSNFPERVKSSVFGFPAEMVFQSAKQACLDLKLHIYATNEKEGKIYARSSLRWLSLLLIQLGYAEKIGIYITPVDTGNTKVEVVLQKSFALDLGYADWRKNILDAIQNNLKK